MSTQDKDQRGTFDALYLGEHEGGVIEWTYGDKPGRLADLVGDPLIQCINIVDGVDLWVGDASGIKSGLNIVASHLYSNLLRDVAAGRYAAGVEDRARARALLSSEDFAPLVFGPCVLLGLHPRNGVASGPLPDEFWNWFVDYSDKLDAQRLAMRIAAAIRAQGIRIDLIRQVVLDIE